MKQGEFESAADCRHDAREQLKAAQHRADLYTLLGMLCIAALYWRNFQSENGAGQWTIASAAVTLLAIGLPIWYATRRKRAISLTRLKCGHCGYVPHDTEISEAAETMTCQQCGKSLD